MMPLVIFRPEIFTSICSIYSLSKMVGLICLESSQKFTHQSCIVSFSRPCFFKSQLFSRHHFLCLLCQVWYPASESSTSSVVSRKGAMQRCFLAMVQLSFDLKLKEKVKFSCPSTWNYIVYKCFMEQGVIGRLGRSYSKTSWKTRKK